MVIPSHNSGSIIDHALGSSFFTKHDILYVRQLPYNPYLAACEFFILKNQIKLERNKVLRRRSYPRKCDKVAVRYPPKKRFRNASLNGNDVWESVWLQQGTTSKEINCRIAMCRSFLFTATIPIILDQTSYKTLLIYKFPLRSRYSV